MTMIQMKQIGFGYKKQSVFRDFSLDIREGETTLITGINGTGKTTLLRLMAGVLYPAKGKIEYAEKLGKNPREYIGFISDQMRLYENMTLKKAMAFHSSVYGIESFDTELYEQTKLKLDKKISELSVGQKMIFHLGLLIAAKPKILLIDEVIHAIDAYLRDIFLDRLLELIEERQITLVMVNLNFHDIERIPQRVILLRNGEIAVDASVEELKANVKKIVAQEASLDLPVLYKRSFSDCNEFYIYPYEENGELPTNAKVTDLNLHDIIKAFIGGEYV